jgi:ATP-dependent Clp protease protease subunit
MSSILPYVIERTSAGERSFDLPSRMLKDRIIFLNGEVNEQSAYSLVLQMIFLDGQGTDDINFYINSPGGSVTSGLAILDTMRYIKSEIKTIVLGQACSFGSLLAACGTPGKRLILPNARHLIHQPLGGASGQASDITIAANEINRLKKLLLGIYVDVTGKDYETILRDTDRDTILTAEESVEYGLADRIVTSVISS